MRPPATETVPCDLCGGEDYLVVGRRDREGRPLQTVLCRQCGLMWTNPRPASAALDRYYATSYRSDYAGARTPTRRKILRGLRGARDRLRSLPPLRAGMRALDVGCGAGEVVYLLRLSGVEATGLDPGEEYGEFARTRLGVPIVGRAVDTAVIQPASHDLITMFHALEHVASPRRVLQTAREWLKPGGMVVVEVPNVESTVQAPSHRFHFAHLYHFSGPTLEALGTVAGLSPTRTTLSADGGNVTCWFRRVESPAHNTGPIDLRLHSRALAATLARHTTLRHYTSATPYRRALGRLRARLEEDRVLRRYPTVDDLLGYVARDAKGPSAGVVDVP